MRIHVCTSCINDISDVLRTRIFEAGLNSTDGGENTTYDVCLRGDEKLSVTVPNESSATAVAITGETAPYVPSTRRLVHQIRALRFSSLLPPIKLSPKYRFT